MPYNLRPKNLEQQFKKSLKMEDESDDQEENLNEEEDESDTDYEYEGDDESSESDSDLEKELDIDQEEMRLIQKDRNLIGDAAFVSNATEKQDKQGKNNMTVDEDDNDMEV